MGKNKNKYLRQVNNNNYKFITEQLIITTNMKPEKCCIIEGLTQGGVTNTPSWTTSLKNVN